MPNKQFYEGSHSKGPGKCKQGPQEHKVRRSGTDISQSQRYEQSRIPLLCRYITTSLRNLRGILHIIFLLGENKRCAPISWQSKKIPRVVKSTLVAETLALQEGLEKWNVLKAFLSQLVGQHEFPISIYTDSKSLAKSVLSTNTVEHECLNMDIDGQSELLEKEEIKRIQWIPTPQELADCLTKKGKSSNKLLQALKGQGTLL